MTCSRDAGRVEESLRNDNDLPLLIPLRHSTLSDFNSAPGRHQRDACMFSKVSEGERFICNSNEIKHFQKEEVSSPTHCSKADHKKSGPKIPKSTINGNGSETEEKSPQEEVSDRPDTVGSKPASSLKFSSPALHSLASLTINCYNSNTSNNNNINDDQLHSIDLRKFPMTLSNPENIKSLSPQNLPVPVSDFWSGHVQSPEGSLEVVSSSFRDPLTLSCNICPFSGDSLEEMDSHLQVSHLTFRCFVCNFTSRSQARLSRHLAENHDNVDGFDFRSKKKEDGKRLKRHRKYSCKQCPFSTSVQEEIWMHTKVHVPASKLLSCPRCPFVCAFKHHMQYHLNNHFGFKPYKCDLCNYRCNNKSMLNSHLKSHSNEYPFKCTKCSYATKYRQALHIHSAKANHALDDREKIESSASNWTKPAKSQRVSFPVEDKSSQKLVGRLDNLWGKTGAAEMKEEPVGASNAVGCINPFNLNFSFPTLKSPSSLSLNSLLMSYVSHQPCEDTVQPHPWTRMTNDGSVGEMLKAEEIKSEEETDQALVSSQTDREPMNSHPLDLRVKRTNLELRYDEEVNRCNFCDLIFHDSVLFWCHMTCHSPGMPFRCNLCGRATKDKVDFFVHLCEFSHNTEALKKFSSDCHSLSLR